MQILREQVDARMRLTDLVQALTRLARGYELRIKNVHMGAKKAFESQPTIFLVSIGEGTRYHTIELTAESAVNLLPGSPIASPKTTPVASPTVTPTASPSKASKVGLVQQVEAVRSTLDLDAGLKMPAVVAAASKLLFASAVNPTGAQPGSLTEQVEALMEHLGI